MAISIFTHRTICFFLSTQTLSIEIIPNYSKRSYTAKKHGEKYVVERILFGICHLSLVDILDLDPVWSGFFINGLKKVPEAHTHQSLANLYDYMLRCWPPQTHTHTSKTEKEYIVLIENRKHPSSWIDAVQLWILLYRGIHDFIMHSAVKEILI